MIRAIADTNIIVSAFLSRRGKPFELLSRALSGDVSLVVSQPMLDELSDVLARKFNATPDEAQEARDIWTDAARIVKPSVQLEVIKDDPDDDRILECAVSAGSNYIVSGDKHLLKLGQYDSILIVKLSDFLDLLEGPAREI